MQGWEAAAETPEPPALWSRNRSAARGAVGSAPAWPHVGASQSGHARPGAALLPPPPNSGGSVQEFLQCWVGEGSQARKACSHLRRILAQVGGECREGQTRPPRGQPAPGLCAATLVCLRACTPAAAQRVPPV